MTVDGLVYRVDQAATQYWPSAFQCGDYRNVDVTIRNGSIHAGGIFGGCTDPLGTFRIEGVDAMTWGHAFSFETPATPGTGADRPPSGVTMMLRNNTIRAGPGRSELPRLLPTAGDPEPLRWRRALRRHDEPAGDRRHHLSVDRFASHGADGTSSGEVRRG